MSDDPNLRLYLIALVDGLLKSPAGPASGGEFLFVYRPPGGGGRDVRLEVRVGPAYVPVGVRTPEDYRDFPTATEAVDHFCGLIK